MFDFFLFNKSASSREDEPIRQQIYVHCKKTRINLLNLAVTYQQLIFVLEFEVDLMFLLVSQSSLLIVRIFHLA